MPAHIKRRERLFIKPIKKGKFRLYSYLILIFLLIFTCLYFLFSRQFWNDKEKLILAIQEKSGNVLVATFDPVAFEITSLTIPGNTEVSAAHNLGVWKLRSVWRLGEDEKIGGKLLAQTLVRHFKFPVAAWADSTALGFISRSPIALIRAALVPYQTNLKVGDRLAIVIFAFRVGNTKRVSLNLAETSYLKKATFVDGEEGYVVSGTPSPGLSAVFADPLISKRSTAVVIRNAMGEGGEIPQEVGKILEVLGAKVASVVKEDNERIDCLVSGKDKEDVKKVARILTCQESKIRPPTSFDLEVKLGEEFAKRF